jgi:hypothetical protein
LSRHSADLTGTTIRTAAQKTGTRRTWVSLGYLAGNHIDAIYHDITRYSYYLLIALPVVLAAYTVWRILRHTRRRTAPASRQAKATQAQDESKTTARNRR